MSPTAAAERPLDTREVILIAALKAFAEQGYDGTSTRDIVARAGVNHGLIRYHFGNKTKLWHEAVDRAFEELRQGVEAILLDSSVVDERERIRRLIRDHVRFVAAHPEFAMLMYDEGKRRGPRMRWMADRHIKPLYEAMSGLLWRAVGAGIVRKDISPTHFFYIVAGSVGVIYHQAEECKRISGIDPFAPDQIEIHARLVESMLLGPDLRSNPT
jgi:TetR/AcrR family transcriptional regulator